MRWLLGAVLAMMAVVVPVALAATGPQPGQRIDLKVLVLAADAGQAQPWQVALQREGVPFDAIYTGAGATSVLSDATLADYGANRARYEGVILATGNLVMTAADQAALTKLESTFGVRQLSDNTFPGADRGLVWSGVSGDQGPDTAALTDAGKALFPYLDGPVPFDAGSWGYPSTPAVGAAFQTLVAKPDGSTLLGIVTHPDGREEMVATYASNQFQRQNQLLRHGIVSWLTRGVYLGYQRNYLELQVDDVFLGDDVWDPATHTTNYDPAAAVRMSADDAAYAASWSQQRGVRLDMVFNGGGSVLFKQANGNTDPLLAGLLANKGQFGWINHTYDHPNLDCSTQTFIRNEVLDNVNWASSNGLSGLLDPSELVTGEHSGLANTRPGNPGTIDPPSLDDVSAQSGGTLAAGTYTYAVTASSANGETIPSTTQETVSASQAVQVSWEAICHAVSYSVYRQASGGAWERVATVPQPATPFTDAGPIIVSATDTGAAGTAAAPPAANGAVIDPYPQNAAFGPAMTAAGVRTVASDASKTYPKSPLSLAGEMWPAGTAFTNDGVTAVPRYPTNVYYNTATQAQQLDEYNWLYTSPPVGNCTPVAGVTTCNTAPVTWSTYVANEASIMFGHVMGNDPRPHYFHQTNLAQTSTATGGVMYPVVDELLTRYRGVFADNAPLVQPSHTQIAAVLARDTQWQADLAAGRVSAYLLDGTVHVDTTASVAVALTGTTVGDSYGAQRSGWATVSGAAEFAVDGSPPPVTPTDTGSGAPAPSGSGSGAGGAAGSGSAKGSDGGGAQPAAPVTQGSPPDSDRTPQGAGSSGQGAVALSLGTVRLDRHRIVMAGAARRRGLPPTSAKLTWKVNRAATLLVRFERSAAGRRSGRSCLVPTARTRKAKTCRRIVVAASLERAVPGGTGALRLTARLGRRTLRPATYRVRVSAVDASGRRTTTRTVRLTVAGA
jgi:hypothetical protein